MTAVAPWARVTRVRHPLLLPADPADPARSQGRDLKPAYDVRSGFLPWLEEGRDGRATGRCLDRACDRASTTVASRRRFRPGPSRRVRGDAIGIRVPIEGADLASLPKALDAESAAHRVPLVRTSHVRRLLPDPGPTCHSCRSFRPVRNAWPASEASTLPTACDRTSRYWDGRVRCDCRRKIRKDVAQQEEAASWSTEPSGR